MNKSIIPNLFTSANLAFGVLVLRCLLQIIPSAQLYVYYCL